MKKLNWCFVIVTAQSTSRVRQIYLSGMVLIALMVVSCAGLAGMARLLWCTGSYAHAKFGVYEARRDNRGLLMKVKFLNKFIAKENGKVNALVAFEDRIRLQYGMDLISKDVRLAGVGGRPTPDELVLSRMLDPLLIQAEAVRERLSGLMRKSELQDSTLSRVNEYVGRIHKKWSQRPSIWPTEGRITSPFGYRFHPIAGHILFHDGIDIANKIWTPVYATADGIIKSVGLQDYFGRMVAINHPESECKTIYAHLHQTAVTEGQVVKRGDLIGYMGSSGRSTGSHLHYEVRVGDRPVNPINYILPTDAIVD
ncbi:MAG: M23 family metallopeptidase [Chitinispirillaceae bacterium]|nr:M23 family metallopeptidase [Chitinispirillaceae bacterium]